MRWHQRDLKGRPAPNSLVKVSTGPPDGSCPNNKIIRQRTGGANFVATVFQPPRLAKFQIFLGSLSGLVIAAVGGHFLDVQSHLAQLLNQWCAGGFPFDDEGVGSLLGRISGLVVSSRGSLTGRRRRRAG